MNEVGCFGKIPAHGDFVWHTLPAEFVTPWDNWIQKQLLELRETVGDSWLDGYLRSAIKRFVVRDDGFGAGAWCGVIAPSVDMVGRYFPFTVAASLPRNVSMVTGPSKLGDWYLHTEECVLGALQETLPLETLLASIRNMPIPDVGERHPDEDPGGSPWTTIAHGRSPWTESMIDTIVHRQFSQPCFWASIDTESGTQRVDISEGVASFTALFDVLPEPV